MSLRPRFASNGVLFMPIDVHIAYRSTERADQDDVLGELARRAVSDPFERVQGDLLLAEEFARMNLTRRRQALGWYGVYGVLDLQHFFPDQGFDRGHPVETPQFHDALDDIRMQQRLVRWHLNALVHLSDHLEEGFGSLVGRKSMLDWKPRWAQPAIQGPSELLWLGATTSDAAHIGTLVQQFARPEDALGKGWSNALGAASGGGAAVYRDAWLQARASFETIQAERIPILWVPATTWTDVWSTYVPASSESAPFGLSRADSTGPLQASWWGLVELQRRLLLPYVTRAAEYELRIERVRDLRVLLTEDPPTADPLAVSERRRWSSLLAPVYLQLLEGLLRVTEGRRGAAYCKECGQPFLILDARRSTFCTDRERFRYVQRERRQRLGLVVTTQATPPESAP